MASISFQWEDVWAIYPSSEPETKESIMIALEGFLTSVSPSAQIKALESAPMPIIKAHSHLLHDKAKKALGLEVEKPKTLSKLFSLF